MRDGWQGPRPSFLPALVARDPRVFIIDLGRGSRWVHALLVGLGLTPRRHVVRDRPQVVDHSRDSPVDDIEDRYFDHNTLGTDSFVVLPYANSSLQNVPDNVGLLEQIRRLRPQTLLIDELLWSRADQHWFTHQRNSDSSSVTRFASSRRPAAEVEHDGIRLGGEGAFGAGRAKCTPPGMSVFSDDLPIDGALSLVFVRERGR